MNQMDLVARLDEYFNVSAYDERDYWHAQLPAKQVEVYDRLLQPGLPGASWNGLILDSTPEIDRVYLIVFPDQAVLDTVLALELERTAPGALIFAHYPADFEEQGRGFIGVHEAQLEELREHRISYYCCHAPLDCHGETSTAIALAAGLKLHGWEPFAAFGSDAIGMVGVHGRVSEADFGSFASQVAALTELPYLRYDQIRFSGLTVQHVAVVPGGGTPEQLEEARALGYDTWVTGLWWPLGDYDLAAQQRTAMRDIVPRLPMNLVGTSRYASEMVVLRDQMMSWFRNAGIEAQFIRQPDPFR